MVSIVYGEYRVCMVSMVGTVGTVLRMLYGEYYMVSTIR
jgi:hypothetical protein